MPLTACKRLPSTYSIGEENWRGETPRVIGGDLAIDSSGSTGGAKERSSIVHNF